MAGLAVLAIKKFHEEISLWKKWQKGIQTMQKKKKIMIKENKTKRNE